MIVRFSALFSEDEDEKVLPGDKTKLLWDKKYLKKPM